MTYPKDNSLFGLSSSGSVCIWTYWDMCIHIFKYQYNRKHARVLPCILLHKLHSGILPQSNSFIATSLPSSLPRCFLVETRFFTARFQGAPQILVSKPPFWLPAQACRQSLGVTGVLRPQIHVVLLGARKMLPEWGPLRFFFSRNATRICPEGETIFGEISGSQALLPTGKTGSKCCKLGEVQWVKHQQNLAPEKKRYPCLSPHHALNCQQKKTRNQVRGRFTTSNTGPWSTTG